ncbi:MAG: adenine phosphoribosyltransferase, partial [Candidatus Omnitrophota bacterium]
MQRLKKAIRSIPDFPKKGILFRDITPLLASPELFREAIGAFKKRLGSRIDAVVSIESRGFILGAALA